jgi:UDP-glucose 4-epimerase
LKKILLTGGMGYIGSHTVIALIEANFEVVLYDNLSNSKNSVLNILQRITGVQIPFIEGDVRDTLRLKKILNNHNIDAVIHFAGLKSVAESVENPIEYYENNITGTISLIKAMTAAKVRDLIFSSSATVYGEPEYLPIDEGHPTSAINPYGRSKLQIEEILSDIAKSDLSWNITCLRYFNPVGAHSSGFIGDNPIDVPNNLMPYICNVASGVLPHLNIYGNDYDTIDGTGVRDYIHIMDLAQGHISALHYLKQQKGYHLFNLGTGQGCSVLEMIKTFEQVSGKTISYQFSDRRLGDVASCFAKVDKANIEMGWKATQTLEDMCSSTWAFQKNL